MQAGPQNNKPHRSMGILLVLLTGLWCLGLFNYAFAAKTTAKAKTIDDVRILVDISGSMKRTDPNNLRRPALRLFVSLLPSEAQSGVWTFGQWVNMLVQHGPADAHWKKNAANAINKINSVGLFTNIEEVLQRATWDWKQADPNVRRSLILLTDGLVDISEHANENELSRQRILEQLLPSLQQSGVAIHTIALSKESDHNLLQQLSSATGGWFETIETTEGLERLFLRLFEKVAQADSLPLTKNKVKVDNSISEMTFLVFRKDRATKTSITTPSGKTFNRTDLPPDTQWHREKRYDLVTVQQPESGNWQINAELDPDNRVMVVTDLKLKNTKLPSSILGGKTIPFQIHLEEKGETIDRKDFLYFVRAVINQSILDEENNGKHFKIKLKDDGKGADKIAKDGIYTTLLDTSLIAGEHEIEVSVNGTTFKRYSRQQFNVYNTPVSASIENSGKSGFIVSVVPYQTLIDANAMRVMAQHELPNGEVADINIPRVSPSEWRLAIDAKEHTGKHKIILQVIGNRSEGGPVEFTLPPLSVNIDEGKAEEPKNKGALPPADKKIEHEPDEASEINWLMVSLRVAIFNLMLGGLAFGGYKLWPAIKRKIIPDPCKEPVNG
jgi:uncharacterized protein (TIGR03503 family)